MMMITKSNVNISTWRYLAILPLTGVLFYFSACTHNGATDQQENTVPSSKQVMSAGNLPEVMPEFNGGSEGLIKFMSENTKYPEVAKNDKTEGRVVLQFVVDEEGKVGSVKVLKSVSKEVDEEAVRVVSSMPAWTPAKHKGQNVACELVLPFLFKLN